LHFIFSQNRGGRKKSSRGGGEKRRLAMQDDLTTAYLSLLADKISLTRLILGIEERKRKEGSEEKTCSLPSPRFLRGGRIGGKGTSEAHLRMTSSFGNGDMRERKKRKRENGYLAASSRSLLVCFWLRTEAERRKGGKRRKVTGRKGKKKAALRNTR